MLTDAKVIHTLETEKDIISMAFPYLICTFAFEFFEIIIAKPPLAYGVGGYITYANTFIRR